CDEPVDLRARRTLLANLRDDVADGQRAVEKKAHRALDVAPFLGFEAGPLQADPVRRAQRRPVAFGDREWRDVLVRVRAAGEKRVSADAHELRCAGMPG